MSASRRARRATVLALPALFALLGPLGRDLPPAAAQDARTASAPGEPGEARVVLLGTGTPNAEPDRWGTAVAVVAGDEAYLFDAGPGVVRRANAARKRGIEALDPARIRRVFLTHLHADHTTGLADLIFTPWVNGRRVPLRVHGPPGTAAMVGHLEAAYVEDVRMRLYGLEPAGGSGWRAEAVEVEPGVVHRDDRVTIRAFPVRHGSWPHAFGYRVDAGGRTIVISGDTAPTPRIVEACSGCDVLVHEVYSAEAFRRRAPEWRRYHSAFHTSATELAALAREARPGILVLYHQLLWGQTPEGLVEEVRAGWRGDVVFGRDLEAY